MEHDPHARRADDLSRYRVGVARRTLFYIRTVQPDISYGFRHGPMRIPFVMHPENFQSNGW